MRIWLGPYEWAERGRDFGWRMPVGATHALDMRSLPEQADRNTPLPVSKTLFVTPDSVALPALYTQIASDPAEALTPARRTLLRTIFGLPTTSATRLNTLVWELLTQHADETGDTVCPPLMPHGMRQRGRMNLWIGGVQARTVLIGPGMPEWPLVRASYRARYRKLRVRALAGETTLSNLHRRHLMLLLRRHGLGFTEADLREFVDADLPIEEPVEPSTTLTESFTTAGDTLGGDHTWTEVKDDWDNNASGRAEKQNAGSTGSARCDSDLSSDDQRVEIDVYDEVGGAAYRGPAARFSASADTCYGSQSRPEINDYYAQKRVAGVDTDIITSELTGSISLPSRDAIEADGSDIELFQGETNSRGTATDTAITGHTRAGMTGYNASAGGVVMDAWEASDLVAGGRATKNTRAFPLGMEIGMNWVGPGL